MKTLEQNSSIDLLKYLISTVLKTFKMRDFKMDKIEFNKKEKIFQKTELNDWICDGYSLGTQPKPLTEEDLRIIEKNLGINLKLLESLNKTEMANAFLESQIYAYVLTHEEGPEIIIFGHDTCFPYKQLKTRLDLINKSKLFKNQLKIREFDVKKGFHTLPPEIQNQIRSVPKLFISGKNINFHYIEDFELEGEIIKGFSDSGPKIL